MLTTSLSLIAVAIVALIVYDFRHAPLDTELGITDDYRQHRTRDLCRVAGRHISPEQQATWKMTEIELVGGPMCGTRTQVYAGKAQWTCVRNGVYYRYDRTAKVVDGRVIFWVVGIIVPVAKHRHG